MDKTVALKALWLVLPPLVGVLGAYVAVAYPAVHAAFCAGRG